MKYNLTTLAEHLVTQWRFLHYNLVTLYISLISCITPFLSCLCFAALYSLCILQQCDALASMLLYVSCNFQRCDILVNMWILPHFYHIYIFQRCDIPVVHRPSGSLRVAESAATNERPRARGHVEPAVHRQGDVPSPWQQRHPAARNPHRGSAGLRTGGQGLKMGPKSESTSKAGTFQNFLACSDFHLASF